MRTAMVSLRAASVAAFALALATGLGAQTTSTTTTTPDSTAGAQTGTASTQEPAAGTAPVGGDKAAGPDDKKPGDDKKPAPGTAPVGGDVAGTDVNPEKVVDPGSQMIKVKPGSIEDVSAVGNRDIGARGMGNWYSVDTEIKMGKMWLWNM